MRQQGQKHFLCLGTRPGAENQPNWPRRLDLAEQRRRTKKIFILEKTSRLRSTNMTGTKIRRILIFDNHPDSLRLVFRRRLNVYVGRSESQSFSSWDLVVLSSAVIVLVVAMFWPLF